MKLIKILYCFSLLSLMGAPVVVGADAEEASDVITETMKADMEFNPLEKAETSSPRDTLRTFLVDLRIAVEGWLRYENSSNTAPGTYASPKTFRALERAVATLDFSTTPNSDARSVVARRALMLVEVLGRMDLPSFEEIPGDAEVARDNIRRWVIPGSSITIERIESGPRAGEFLFSAWTVRRIPRFYFQVKHLPYKSDALNGIYERYLASKKTLDYLESQIRNRLKPIDNTTPRSTFNGFLDSVNRAYALVMETNAALKADPPKITVEEARNVEKMALNLINRAVGTLDLNKVPKAIRSDVGIEGVLQLKEILDRMMLPFLDSVPDMEMVMAERDRLGKTALGNTRPVRWRIPNTSIEIVEIMEGPQKGNYLFSAATVNSLADLYEKVRDLPYRGDYSQVAPEYRYADRSKGFYNFYISTPGQLIPQTTLLGRWGEAMPGWLDTMYRGQTLWQWIALGVTLVVILLFLVVMHGILLRRPTELSDASRNRRRVLFNLIVLVTLHYTVIFLDQSVNLTGAELMVVRTCITMAEWYFLATGVLFLANAIAETVVASPRIDPEGIKASYVRAVFGILGLVLMAVLIINGLFHVGVSLGPLLASVGIGGLAVALAARPTLENIIGSFMIFLDKPFRVGQRVNVLGQNGTVESIGLRSTKIRLLTGHLTSIPNEKMANAEVENIGRRPHIRRLLNVTVTYDTPPEKIARGVEIIREILTVPETPESAESEATGGTEDFAVTIASDAKADQQPHPNEAINHPDFPPWVYFNELNADSLNILIIYWYHPAVYQDYLEHSQWINLQIMERFNAEGIDFAFPTQTLHMAGDDKRPLTVGQRWVSKEESLSPSAILAQAAALGAQAAQTTLTPASDAVRPQVSEAVQSKAKVEGELTDAPIEDGVLHGDTAAEGEEDDRP
ncbi:Potassium efflux system KefA protein / Small-conductance mechanosensitive channel [Olavius algarvensis Delta 1 endosymbiont]|nr:Potassium efflux system KefA protein / Small-conductance mechanosensitive channel [Olavius algarvensis Delta 1 endosymbiont]